MAKFDIKTVKPKFVVTTSPDNKIEVVVNKPIITSKRSKSFFQLKNTGGPKGEKGDKGDAATITVASTSTGAAGTDASVVNQGTPQDVQLAFTIPRGDKGEKGDKGNTGYSPTVVTSRESNYVQIDTHNEYFTTTAKVYDGAAATVAVDSTTTLPAGSSATVENVGTSSAASLAFGIPQGVPGQDGTDGFSPSASVTQTASGATISITDKDGTTTADVNNGTDGADGDAATITVGQVETLQPNQSAYVTNVGTSSAAIFNIGIPQGQKGESGSGTGDMLASDYDPNSTVKNAGGIPDYVSGQVNDATLTITQNGVTAGTFSANASTAATIALTDTTYSDMTGATSSAAGAHGLVPAPAAGDQVKYLKGDGTWGAFELVELSYGEANAWAKFIDAYTNKKIVYCRASSNADPSSGSQTRKAFMAYVNNESSPTSVEFQYYRSVSSHSDSQQGDQVFVYTLKNTNGGTWSVVSRNTFSKVVAGANMTSSYSSGAITLNATQPTVNNATLTITQNGTSAGTFTANSADDTTIALTDTTYDTMTGASSSTAGASGLVPAPAAGDEDKVLKGDGTWGDAAATAIVAYINGAHGGSWTSSFDVYTTSSHTTAYTYQEIQDSIEAGVPVIFRTSDNYDITITGLLGVESSVHYYTALYDGFTLGTITYTESTGKWAYIAGTQINDATLTIQKNGTTIDTFTANALNNKTVNITVPTGFSDLSGTVAANQFANGTIDKARLNWSTFRYNFTGSSDNNGFVPVPTSIVKPTTGFILAARAYNKDAFCTPFGSTSEGRYGMKCETWDRQPFANQSIRIEIIYCLLNYS